MIRFRMNAVVFFGVTVAVLAGDPTPTNRPARWAQPVRLEGVPNLHKVTESLYRSAQPSASGMRNLKAFGIRTVLNLRAFHSDGDEIGSTGLGQEHIRMTAWHPEEEDVVRSLRIVSDPARAPVLVHCLHGADRTGTLCAIYRVAVQGWTKEEAIREMTQGGFGFHEVWQNLPSWIGDLDVNVLKARAGLKPATDRTPGKREPGIGQ